MKKKKKNRKEKGERQNNSKITRARQVRSHKENQFNWIFVQVLGAQRTHTNLLHVFTPCPVKVKKFVKTLYGLIVFEPVYLTNRLRIKRLNFISHFFFFSSSNPRFCSNFFLVIFSTSSRVNRSNFSRSSTTVFRAISNFPPLPLIKLRNFSPVVVVESQLRQKIRISDRRVTTYRVIVENWFSVFPFFFLSCFCCQIFFAPITS